MRVLTQGVTAAQLWLLLILALQLISDAVEQLHVALVRVLLQTRNEGPGHGACGFAADGSIGPEICVSSASFHSFAIHVGQHLRGLCVFRPTPHDDICGTSLRP
jgi:hypothetical protein